MAPTGSVPARGERESVDRAHAPARRVRGDAATRRPRAGRNTRRRHCALHRTHPAGAGELRKIVLARTMLVDAGRTPRRQAAVVAAARRGRRVLRVRRAADRSGGALGAGRRDARAARSAARPRGGGDAVGGFGAAVRRRAARPGLGRPAVRVGQGARGARGRGRGRRAHPGRVLRAPRAPARTRAARYGQRLAPRHPVPW